jgi:hypothetical protein
MAEVWLRNNQRAWAISALPAIACAALAILMILGTWQTESWAIFHWLGWCILVLSMVATVVLIWQARRPRLAYEKGHLLVNLRGGSPLRVPLEVIECFLLGHGPSLLPGRNGEEIETSTVVIRLSPKAADWACGAVDHRLGCWCESHLIVRGTWCEPLNIDVVRRLNVRLGEVTRQWRKSQTSEQASP